ncbi:restriction endonuclease subunit S [Streptosporangium sp. NPDC002721]|uniref:restriction endonuclease subunit S n=1 Tax=Streptosporangium sp. NPDC002721 TaxID=3366188 RepID=UPI003695E892
MCELPEGWTWRKLTDVVTLPSGQVSPLQLPYLKQPLIAPDHIESGTGRLLEVKTAEEQGAISGKYVIQPGDVVYSKIRPALRKATLVTFDGLCSADMYPLRPSPEINSQYLLSVILGERFSRFAHASSGRSGIPKINRDELDQFHLALPPIGEQEQIAEILDTVSARQQATKKIITKLKAARQAVLRQAINPGLAPLSKLEASQLSSIHSKRIGDWTINRLSDYVYKIDAGKSPELEDTPAGPGQWGVLKVSSIRQDHFSPEENKVVRDPTLFNKALCVQPGDLLMSRANTVELVGLACIVEKTPQKIMLCDKTLRLHVENRLASTDYVNLMLGITEVRRQITVAATGTSGSMKNISQESIKNILIPVPRREEMEKIVKVDGEFRTKIALLDQESSHLDLLKQGLIDDLLTGYVRVSLTT